LGRENGNTTNKKACTSDEAVEITALIYTYRPTGKTILHNVTFAIRTSGGEFLWEKPCLRNDGEY
jgi:hypothetical protein